MANPVKRVPEGYHTVTPHLVVRGATQAIAFYQKAFGARQLHCHLGPSGKVMHAELQLGDSRIDPRIRLDLVLFGAAGHLRGRVPAPGEARIETPDHLRDFPGPARNSWRASSTHWGH